VTPWDRITAPLSGDRPPPMNAHEGGFTHPVSTQQADPLTGGHRQVHPIQQWLRAEAHGNIA
jgi:hypothetical protein